MRHFVEAFFFDLDGTLVDSALDFDLMREEMGLLPGTPILEQMACISDPAEASRLMEIVNRHEMEGALRARPFEGVIELLQWLERLKIPTGIVTRNSAQVTHLTLKKIPHHFKVIHTRDDQGPPKPDPYGLLASCSTLGVAPSNCLYMGDYKFDLQAGRAAGMTTILYTRQLKADRFSHLADYRFDCFYQLRRELPALLKKSALSTK